MTHDGNRTMCDVPHLLREASISQLVQGGLLKDAADEIERLRAECGSWQGLLSAALDELDASDETGLTTAHMRQRAKELLHGRQ